ncbi:MAG: methylcrotonoyl-CoA carboxylase [Candidatus Riflebacteria bacterium]|nr:methylcrotonoyl-CoA carboxylase [Candidatus Riflebacteria bacterium]
MRRIQTKIQPSSPEFRENVDYHKGLARELQEKLQKFAQGGPKHAREKHTARGKLLVRDRLAHLFDPNTPFLELCPLAALSMYEDSAPAAGMVTGIGVVNGREVMIVANDATVKGGTYFPMTIKKHLRAQEVAMENNLPCIYLVDSGGIFLPHQSETFPDREHFGRIFYNQARMSAMGIPQISVVMGSCTAGGAYVPAMSDESVIVKNQGTIFIGGPPLVKAATGEIVTEEELGGADVHCRISGVADHYAENDAHAISIARDIVEALAPQNRTDIGRMTPEDPFYDPEELYGIVPKDDRKPFDVREIIARIVDGSRFQEFKALYGLTVVCGFARIMGYPVGIIGNNGVLFSESSLKAAHFVTLCSMRKIPLIFLQNITGFIVGKQYEHGGIARDGAKLVHAVSNADVPKFTIVIGGSYGAGNYGMCGRAFGPRFMWMWPNSKICVMGGKQAAGVLSTVKVEQLKKQGQEITPEMLEQIQAPILARYEEEANCYYSTGRIWDDGIIDLKNTRNILGLGIPVTLNSQIPNYKLGIMRM